MSDKKEDIEIVAEPDRLLYRAICANPDDDTVRLMFADCLDEIGEKWATIQAQYIRDSIAMQHPPDEEAMSAIVEWNLKWKALEQVLRDNASMWTANIPPIEIRVSTNINVTAGNQAGLAIEAYDNRPREITYDRGFPMSVECKTSEITNNWFTGITEQTIAPFANHIVRITPVTALITSLQPYKHMNRTQIRTIGYRWIMQLPEGPIKEGRLPEWLFNSFRDYCHANSIDTIEHGYQRSSTGIINFSQPFIEFSTQREAILALGHTLGNRVRKVVYG